ncbi:MAG TPA: polysaccharide deacetylase family protein [Candidatus Limnocylindrales bacterium]
MTETSQTASESPRSGRGRASRAVPGMAAAAIALAVIVVLVGSAAGAGLGPFSKASPAVEPGIALATPRTTDSHPTVAPSQDPADTGPSEVPAASATCRPEYNNGCLPVAAPTRNALASQGPGPDFTVHVPILEYHRIKPAAGETGYTAGLITPPEIFQAQMTALSAAGWHTITMGQLGDDLRLGIQPTAKSFVVTFDDGYEDGFTYAYPILVRHGFVGTYFVVGSQIGTADHLTVAELQTLHETGSEIGNHTIDHIDLVPLTPENQVREIYGNSDLIARDIGVWPQSFAYPAGFADASVMAAVAATPGLETAVVQQSSKPQTWANRWQLPRIRVGPGTYPQDLLDKVTRYVT